MSLASPPDRPSGNEALARIGDLDPAVSALLLDTVLTRSGTGVVLLDSQFRYLAVNDVAAAINGVPAADHLGRRLREVIPGVASSIEPVLATVLETGEPVLHLDVSGETGSAPGESRWWSASVIRLARPNETSAHLLAVVFIEVTEARRDSFRLRQLIDNLFTFVGLLSPDGTMLEANQVALDAGGLSLDDVLGRPFWEVSWWSHDPAVQRQLRQAVSRASAGEPSRYDVLIRLAGDLLVPIDFQLAPIMENGVVTALVPSGLEISARLRESDRLASLARFSAALNAAATTGEVVVAVLNAGQAMEDASFVNLAVVDNAARCIRIAMNEIDPDVIEKWATVPMEGMDTPLHLSISSGQIITVSNEQDRRRRYPHLVDDTIQVGLEATVSLPLFDEAGDALGSIGLGWPEPIQVTREAESRFQLLIDLCSQAMQRTRRSGVLANLVESLQTELLTIHNPPDGLDIAVEYRPAVNDIGFGGDWYDVIDLGARVALVVGDVAGHGIAAAAQMAQIKGLLRGLITAGSLGDLMGAASRALAATPMELLATACVATVDTLTGEVEWVSAGHPPPAVLRPDGSAEFLPGAPVPPIGVARTATTPWTYVLDPGTMVVLYTDGLVERRGRGLDEGLDELLVAMRSLPAGSSAATVRDRILEQLIPGGNQGDDVAIVAVRFPLSR